MKNRLILICVLIICIYSNSWAQEILGLWEVKNVTVGEENMTPMSKWTRINEDGTFETGNGWLQNAAGRYTFNRKTSLFEPTEQRGITDEFGPFKISLEDNSMTWEREEEGMKVLVSLERINNLPLSPADLSVGMWKLEKYIVNGEDKISEMDPKGKRHLFIRWDRIFLHWDKDGKRETGIWHMNGHRPLITFIPNDQSKPRNSWNAEVDETKLLLSGATSENENTQMHFIRVHEFPK